MGFFEDLQRGEVGQELAKQTILDNISHFSPMFTTVMASGMFKSWDIEMRLTAEVKYDEASEKYGNLCFEEASLNHTQSDIWVHIYHNGTFIFNTQDLRKTIETIQPKKKVAGGDGNRQTLYIYSINQVKQKFPILLHEEKK